jgi:hypothetical protein
LFQLRVGPNRQRFAAGFRYEELIDKRALFWSRTMQEVKVKRMLSDIPTAKETTREALATSERIVRIALMSAFVGVLVIEAWLLWQVYQLF